MRVLLVLLAGAVLALYLTIGVRIGFLTVTPAWLWNANGTNAYTVAVRAERSRIVLDVDTAVRGGQADMQLVGPGGAAVWRASVASGRNIVRRSFTLQAPSLGEYRFRVNYLGTTGQLNVFWTVTNF